MIIGEVYTKHSRKWRMLDFTVIIIFILIPSLNLSAQGAPEYDEISLFMELSGVGGYEIPAIIKGEDLYLPVSTLFELFKIKVVPDPGSGSITGFIIHTEAKYLISRENNKVVFNEKDYELDTGEIIRTEYDLFLHAPLFGKIFGIDCNFSFRNLSVKVTTKLELPLIREMRLEEMRKNLSRLKGEIETDTNINRSYPIFRFGMADWSIIADQDLKGKDNSRVNLSLGAMLAGGEATASLYYNSAVPLEASQQHFLWKYVDNDRNLFKQISVGNVYSQSVATIFNPVVGVQVTNTPSTYRRSFGTYPIVDRTEPGWIVELYVNNVLVDYVKADASGLFRFEVPLSYGNSLILLKFYGPWGEEKVREQNINIPYNFIPEKTFEYKFSAGVVEDSSLSKFSRLAINYGVSRRFTVGIGYEYLSSVRETPAMPFISSYWNVFDNLLLSGEYMHGVHSKATLNYRAPSSIDLEATYIKYAPGQKAIFYNYLEERKASVTLPFRLKKLSFFNRLSVNQLVLPFVRYSEGEVLSSTTNYTTASWVLSGSYLGHNINLSTYANLLDKNNQSYYSNLTVSLRGPWNTLIIPQLQYGITRNEVMASRLAIEKSFKGKAFLNFSVERNFISNMTMADLGFRYNFRFGQFGASVRQGSNSTSFVEYGRGSLIYDRKTKYLGFDNKNNVGRGGISIIPFIDVNANGRKDVGEPKAYGLNVKVMGGFVQKSEKDTTIRVLGLEPYTKCFIELDANSFENISWRLPVKIMGVEVDPDILKHIEIPITVVGEVTGSVTVERYEQGEGRVIVNIYNKADKKLAGKVLSEGDGYYSYFGLKPGEYYAQIDSLQLNTLGMSSFPLLREFVISRSMEGDYIDGIDFTIRIVESDTLPASIKREPEIRKDTSIMIIHEVVEELVTITNDSWAIQLGAFKNRTNADNLRRNLERMLGKKVDIIIADGFFKVRINEIQTRREVDEIIENLRKNGITELWLISLKAKQQMIVQRDVQDSIITIVDTFEEEPGMFEAKIFPSLGDSFYNLDRKPIPLIDQTVVDIMESKSSLDEVKFNDIRTVTRIVRTDTTELVIAGSEGGKQLARAGSYRVAGEEIIVTRVTIPFNAPLLSRPVEKTINTDEAPAKVSVPEISLQVGIYYKKSEALRAQKKIMSKLNVPVKIVQQWEYYKVIVTGFNSREEAFPYYPELAGIGFPGPVLIEE